MKKSFSLLMILLLMVNCCIIACADVESFAISQIYQEYDDDTRLHVRVESTGAVNGHATQITPEYIEKATIGTGTTPVLNVHSVTSEQSEGMTFMFILDHAMPIGTERVKELKKGVNSWIDAMGEKDCAAILVSEEDEIRYLTDGFVSDKKALHAAVEDYGRANENAPAKNMIFSAIREGILMTTNQARMHPRNCCIIVCSNGADTYQTLVTAEGISSLLSENNLPMYVVGYAYKNAKSSLATLINLARNSGGWSEDATPSNDQGTIDEAFDRLRSRIFSGYDITLDCSDGFVFNGSTLVSLKFRNQDTPVKRTADLYLLKKDDPTSAPARPAAENTSQPTPVSQESDDQNDDTNGMKTMMIENAHYFAIAALVVCVLLIAVLGLRKKKKGGRKPQGDQPHPADIELPTDITSKGSTSSGKTEVIRGAALGSAGSAESPSAGVLTERGGESNQIDLTDRDERTNGTDIHYFQPQVFAQKIIFEYQIPGQSRKTAVFNNPMEISIGRKPGNTLVLDSPKVSGNHARIWFEDNRVWIDNISSIVNGKKNDLYVDNQRVEAKTALSNPCHINIATVSMDVSYQISSMQTPATGIASSQMDDDGKITMRKVPPTANTERAIPIQITWSLRGVCETRKIPLAHQVTIGRSESDTVKIPDTETTVSQHHVILERRNDGIIVRNGSKNAAGLGKNPFYCKNVGVTEEIPFEDGMELYLGDAKVTISIMRGM